jgi:hypothetical protein
VDSFPTGQGPVADCCEYGNELICSTEGGTIFYYLSDYCRLRKDSALFVSLFMYHLFLTLTEGN